jgi:hypothetical protein
MKMLKIKNTFLKNKITGSALQFIRIQSIVNKNQWQRLRKYLHLHMLFQPTELLTLY